jgi:hypothetical protein
MPPEIGRMQGFVADLLTQQGALVELIEPEGLEVLAPPPVQQALGVKELSRLGFGATLPAGARAGCCGRMAGRRRIRNACWSTCWCWTMRRSDCSM